MKPLLDALSKVTLNPYSPLIGAAIAIGGVLLPAIAPLMGRVMVVSGGLILVMGVVGRIRRLSR